MRAIACMPLLPARMPRQLFNPTNHRMLADPPRPWCRFEYAVERMALRSRLGGEARLQQAICLGALDRAFCSRLILSEQQLCL